MKALVSIYQTAGGRVVHLLAAGNNEQQARQRAYAATHHGHNPYDDELWSGTLLDCTEHLAELIECGDYTLYMRTIGELFVNESGMLDTRAQRD